MKRGELERVSQQQGAAMTPIVANKGVTPDIEVLATRATIRPAALRPGAR